jgi:hypothetical protein
VARIPVRTAAHATAYIDKLLAFESNPTRFNGKMLLGGMYAWDTYTAPPGPATTAPTAIITRLPLLGHTSVSDSEMWDRRLYRDGILPYWTASNSLALFCDTLTTWDTTFGSGNYAQNATKVKNKFNWGGSHVLLGPRRHHPGGVGNGLVFHHGSGGDDQSHRLRLHRRLPDGRLRPRRASLSEGSCATPTAAR